MSERQICGIRKANGDVCGNAATVLTEEKGLICTRHYQAYRKHDLVERVERTCSILDCTRAIYGNEMCSRHYGQVRMYGKVQERTIRDPNEIAVSNNIAEMTIYDRRGRPVATALLDEDMLEGVRQHKWCREGNGYVMTGGRHERRKLHHLVMGKPPEGMEIDHINRNRLDNRRENLRFVTRPQNCANAGIQANNTSGVTGVCWAGHISKWIARITVKGKRLHLGVFTHKQDAAEARRNAEEEYLGEYAPRRENKSHRGG